MPYKISEEAKVDQFNVTADITTATDVGWVDMSEFSKMLVSVMAVGLTGAGITAFKILGNTESDGSGTDITLATHALGTAPDAAGDIVVLEITKEQLAADAPNVRYVSANLQADNAADDFAVTYVRSGARYPAANLTADAIS